MATSILFLTLKNLFVQSFLMNAKRIDINTKCWHPRPKLLDGNILLKFFLKTILKSASFDTLDDLPRFRVQKL